MILGRAKKFESIISFLENLDTSKKKENIDLNFILSYHVRVSKLLNLKKCFTTSMACFQILKKYGYKAVINISISNESKFFSHAWISVNDVDYFNEKKDLVDIITIG